MDTTYQWLARFAQSAGLLYFVGIFLAVCFYAFWPQQPRPFRRSRPYSAAGGLSDGQQAHARPRGRRRHRHHHHRP